MRQVDRIPVCAYNATIPARFGMVAEVKQVLYGQAAVALLLMLFGSGMSLVAPERLGEWTGQRATLLAWRDLVGALLYGSILAMATTILGARSVWRASRQPNHFAWLPIYLGLLHKLAIVGGGIAIGLSIGFPALPLLVSYLAVQLASAWVFVGPDEGSCARAQARVVVKKL